MLMNPPSTSPTSNAGSVAKKLKMEGVSNEDDLDDETIDDDEEEEELDDDYGATGGFPTFGQGSGALVSGDGGPDGGGGSHFLTADNSSFSDSLDQVRGHMIDQNKGESI